MSSDESILSTRSMRPSRTSRSSPRSSTGTLDHYCSQRTVGVMCGGCIEDSYSKCRCATSPQDGAQVGADCVRADEHMAAGGSESARAPVVHGDRATAERLRRDQL